MISSTIYKELESDNYEEYLVELDRLSYKQIATLVIIDEFALKASSKLAYECTQAEKIALFKLIKAEVHNKISEVININDIDKFLVALSNSRCYQQLDYFINRHSCGDGLPTEFYYQLKQYAKINI